MMRENKSWQEGWVRDKNDKVKHVVDKRVLVNLLKTCRIVWEINNKLEGVQEITNVGKKICYCEKWISFCCDYVICCDSVVCCETLQETNCWDYE